MRSGRPMLIIDEASIDPLIYKALMKAGRDVIVADQVKPEPVVPLIAPLTYDMKRIVGYRQPTGPWYRQFEKRSNRK
jgi:hypothetical protein